MKIEKLSDNQIRCTLTKVDLTIREMNLHELTYGSENARNLFREMIQQASTELDFHAEDIPLMIEAIPVPNDGIILLITKLEDPDELDTRFSKFTPSTDDTGFDGYDYYNFTKEAKDGIDDIVDTFNTMEKTRVTPITAADPYPDNTPDGLEKSTEKEGFDVNQVNLIRIFSFPNLDTVSDVAAVLKDFYRGENSLYKDEIENVYHLVLNKPPHSPVEYNQICNILSEYGIREKNMCATAAFYEEHYTKIINQFALQVLADL